MFVKVFASEISKQIILQAMKSNGDKIILKKTPEKNPRIFGPPMHGPRQDVNQVVFTSSSIRQCFVLFIKKI